MALSVTVVRGYTMVAGVAPTVDDWNAGFLPSVTLTGAVGTSDLADSIITFDHLNPSLLLGETPITSLSLTDRFLIGDDSAGSNAVATFQTVLQSAFSVGGFPTNITEYTADLLLFWNVAGAVPYAMNIERFLSKSFEQIVELTTTDQDDTTLVRETSATEGAQIRKVSLRNLLPDIIAAQTVNNPTQIVLDAKGRVTAISGSAGGDKAVSGDLTLPVGAGTAGTETVWPHGLAQRPAEVSVMLKCNTNDGTWVAGDVIDHRSVMIDTSGASDLTHAGYVVLVDATNVTLLQPTSASTNVPQKTDGADQTFDPTKWVAIIRARL